MSATEIIPFTTPGNYSYDSDLIEVTGGVGKLKNQIPTDATFHANFASDEDGNWGDGVLTGTLTSATVASGVLNCQGGGKKYCTWAAADNADQTQTGCIRFTYIPAYTGAPGADRGIYTNGGAGDNNLIEIKHAAAGNLNLRIRDSSGSLIVDLSGAWSPTASTPYEFEINWDVTAGATRLFINGTQFGTTNTNTGTRTATTTDLRLGTDRGANLNADADFDDLIIFDTVQHTTDYTPGASIPATTYSITNPTITPNTNLTATELLTFVEAITAAGLDAVKYILTVGGQDKWSNGGVVENSDGTYAESNTAAEITAVIGDFLSARLSVQIKVFLHSDDGSTTPEIDTLTITYNSALPDPTLPTLVNVAGWLYDNDGPVSGAGIYVRPFEAGFINGDIHHQYTDQLVATTASDGYWDGFVFKNPEGKYWDFKFGIDGKRYKVDLLDQTEMKIVDAPTYEPIVLED